jgi:hypothetical protein
LAGTLGTANGGTNLTSFTSGGVVYASSSSALATGSGLVFDGTNLGLAVTPSAWAGITGGALEIATNGAAFLLGTGSQLFLGNNAFYGSSGWVYKRTAGASYAYQASGQHQWYTAASGTAGNAISFTQAMTLTAAGQLLVGSTSAIGSPYIQTRTTNSTTVSGTYAWNSTDQGISLVNESNTTGTGIGITMLGGSSRNSIGAIYMVQETGNSLGALAFYTGGAGLSSPYAYERARIDSSGNFGIGTSSPSGKLHVAGGASNVQFYLSNNSYSSYYYQNTGGTSGVTFPASQAYVWDAGGTERMRINASGNVGIGVSSAGQKLDVNGDAIIRTEFYLLSNGGTMTGATSPSLYSPATGALGISTNGSEQMRITSAGNVGIGTSSPSYKLDVNGVVSNTPNSARFAITSGRVDATNNIRLEASGTASTYLEYRGFLGHIWDVDTTERMRLDSSGNLLVGATSTIGTVGNYANVLGGVFKSFSGSVSAATNTYVTLFGASGGTIASYLVTVWVSADDVGNYQANVIVNTQGGTSTKVTTLVAGSLLGFQMSGYNFQATQNSGGTATINYSAIRIAG